MGQGRFGHDRILSGVIMCHVVGNNGVFPERGSRGPCVGFWGPGSIWQRMWYFCAKFLWIKGVFYHGLCVIIYAGRIVPCLHWYLIRVIGRMTSLEWFSIWEASNNIINFNDVRKRLWKLIWLSKVFLLEIRVDWKGLYARSCWRPDSLERVLLLSVDLLGDARDHLVHLKWTTWNTYVQSVSKTSQQRTNIFHWENNHPVDCEMEMLSLWNGFRQALWTLCP